MMHPIVSPPCPADKVSTDTTSSAAPRGYEAIKALAEQLGVPIPHLLALDRKNDPFFAGTPGHWEKARWFAALWEQFDFPPGVHLRRIHYHLVTQKPPVSMLDGSDYENT